MVKKFEVGKTYHARSLCDYDCIYSFKVTKRSEKTITILYHGEETRRGIRVTEWGKDGMTEVCKPLGSYSMAPMIVASEDQSRF